MRNTPRNRRFGLFFGVTAAGWAGFAGLLVYGALKWGDPIVLPIAAGFLAVAAYQARTARRSLQAGILLDHGTVTIVNPRSTCEIAASSVERFVAGLQESTIGNGTPGVLAELRDGSVIAVWTLAREGLVWNIADHAQYWQETADDLNRVLRELGSGSDVRRS